MTDESQKTDHSKGYKHKKKNQEIERETRQDPLECYFQ